MTIFEKFATEYKEPLYGRMNGQILLKPLAPIVEAEIFSDLDLFTPANWLRFHFLQLTADSRQKPQTVPLDAGALSCRGTFLPEDPREIGSVPMK